MLTHPSNNQQPHFILAPITRRSQTGLIISYPVPQHPDLAPSSSLPPESPHTDTMSHSRRPSIPNWLSRSSSSIKSSNSNTASGSRPPYAPSRPVRISEPKFLRSLESLNQHRSGPLGSGAEVVRTPQDALNSGGVQVSYECDSSMSHYSQQDIEEDDEMPLEADDELPSPPLSPIFPPLPPSTGSLREQLEEDDAPPVPEKRSSPPPPTRAPPSPPINSTFTYPAVKPNFIPESMPSITPSTSTNVLSSLPQPPFEAILVSGSPSRTVDPSKMIVSLETDTQTYRTTLNTLSSRPSHLADFLTSLMPKQDADDHSVYSEDLSAYHQFLASQSLLPTSSFTLHIFLDRPSAPYTHILRYLRSPLPSPGTPETLPRSPESLGALLELRDEASYLGLQQLYDLCTAEIARLSPMISTSRGYHRSQGSGASSTLANISDEMSSGVGRGSSLASDEMRHCKSDSKSTNETYPARTLATPLSMRRRRGSGSRSSHSHGDSSSIRSPPLPLSGRWI